MDFKSSSAPNTEPEMYCSGRVTPCGADSSKIWDVHLMLDCLPSGLVRPRGHSCVNPYFGVRVHPVQFRGFSCLIRGLTPRLPSSIKSEYPRTKKLSNILKNTRAKSVGL